MRNRILGFGLLEFVIVLIVLLLVVVVVAVDTFTGTPTCIELNCRGIPAAL